MYKLCVLFLLMACIAGIEANKTQISTFWDRNFIGGFKPTVVPANPFDPRKDAAVLRKVMDDFLYSEKKSKAIIQLLTRRTNEQRTRILLEMDKLYGTNLLITVMTTGLNDEFQNLLLALMTPLPVFFAIELHDAMAGSGTDEDTLIEIMCTMSRSNHEIQLIKQAYSDRYGRLLEDDLRGDTSGEFMDFMISLSKGNRSEDFHVNRRKAREDARNLREARELSLPKHRSTFIEILSSQSFPQLAAVFQQYKLLTRVDIDEALKAQPSSNFKNALRTTVKVVRNEPLFFAERLYTSMIGLGTDERMLNRIMVTRCEVDLGNISDVFQARYKAYAWTLQNWIEDDCSGYYLECLLGLLGVY